MYANYGLDRIDKTHYYKSKGPFEEEKVSFYRSDMLITSDNHRFYANLAVTPCWVSVPPSNY